MGFDRSQFGATSIAVLKRQEADQDRLRPSHNGKAGYHALEEGDNIFRIAPFHPDSLSLSFAEPKTVSFLTVSVPKKDISNNVIEGESEEKRTPVFNARVHGFAKGTEKDKVPVPLSTDLVETYLSLLKKKLSEDYAGDKESKEREWAKAVGFNSKDAIKPVDSWVMYAWKMHLDDSGNNTWKLGILEVKRGIRNQMNDISSDLEFSGISLHFDPFTDPNEGYPIVINKNSEAGKKDPVKYYKVSFLSTKKKIDKAFQSIMEPVPLTDEQLKELAEEDSLYKKMRGGYTYSNFIQQIQGLEYFDKKHGFKIIELDQWKQSVEYLSEKVVSDHKEENESGIDNEVYKNDDLSEILS